MQCLFMQLLTGVFPSLIPLDEADDEENQDEQSDSTHEANEPSLGGDVHLSAHHSCPGEEKKTSHLQLDDIFPEGSEIKNDSP